MVVPCNIAFLSNSLATVMWHENMQTFTIEVGLLERPTKLEVLLAWRMPCGTRSKRSVPVSNVQQLDEEKKRGYRELSHAIVLSTRWPKKSRPSQGQAKAKPRPSQGQAKAKPRPGPGI